MDGFDGFDFGLRMLPRKIARVVILALVDHSGGHFVTWYAQEQAESAQWTAEKAFESFLANLPTPTLAPSPAAPAQTPYP